MRAAAVHARAYDYSTIPTATGPYHQRRVGMVFRLMGLSSTPILMTYRGAWRLRAEMWLRGCAAIPYDFVAGFVAAQHDRTNADKV